MDHELAVRDQSAARYLLGEMPAAEREEFEEHYFSCVDCADEVRQGAVFRANAREIWAAQEQRAEARAGWLERLFGHWRVPVLAPYAATAAMLAVTVYQSTVTIPDLRRQAEAQEVSSYALRPAARGTDQTIQLAPGARAFHVMADLNTTKPYASLECQVMDAQAKTVMQVAASGAAAGRTLNLMLPAAPFAPGDYILVVRGRTPSGNTEEVERFTFTIEKR